MGWRRGPRVIGFAPGEPTRIVGPRAVRSNMAHAPQGSHAHRPLPLLSTGMRFVQVAGPIVLALSLTLPGLFALGPSSPKAGSWPKQALDGTVALGRVTPGVQSMSNASPPPGGVAYTLVPMNGSVLPGLRQPGIPGASGIAYDPIDNRVFVGPGENGGVAAINASTGQPLGTLYIPQATWSMAFDPRLDEVFAAGHLESVVVFNASTYALVARGIVQASLDSIVYDATDDRLFAASDGTNSLYVIDPNNDTVVGSSIPLDSLPFALLYDPQGDQVYVTLQDRRVLGLDAATVSWNLSANWSIGGGAYSLTLVPQRNWIYVGNYGSSNVTVINASTGRVIASGITVGPGPIGTQYYPPNDSVLVTTGGAIYEINVSSNTVTNSAAPEPAANDIAYDSADKTVYVTAGGALGAYLSDYVVALDPSTLFASRDIQLQFPLTGSAYDPSNGNVYVIDPTGPNGTGAPTGVNWTVNGPSSVLVINGTTHRFQPYSFTVGHDAEAIQYDRLDSKLYVANEGADSVSAIDPVNRTVSTVSLTAGFRPDALGIDSRRNWVYVGGLGSDNLSIINGSTGSVLPGVVPVGNSPTSILYDPSSDQIYVGNCGSDNVSVINASSRAAVGWGIPVGTCPDALLSVPASAAVFVANEGSFNVTVINRSSGRSIGSVAVGFFPDSMVLDSGNGLVYVANLGSDNLSVIDPADLKLVGPGVNVLPPDAPSNVAPLGLSYDPVRAEVYVPTLFASALFVVANVPGLASLTISSPETEVGVTVQLVTSISGGTPPYSYAYGGLPRGCPSVNSSVLICQPQQAGNFSITVTITDSHNYSAQSGVELAVLPALAEDSLAISPGTVDTGVPVTFTVESTGGFPPFTVSYLGLPPGCTSANASVLRCTPTAPGVYVVEATMMDSDGVRTEAVASLVVAAPPSIFLFEANPSVAPVGSFVAFYVGVAGGVAPFSYVYENLPPGCVSANQGVLSCAPNTPGEFNVTVSVADSFGLASTASFEVTVVAPALPSSPVILAFFASPSTLILGNDTAFIVVATGGALPLTLNYSGLPPGCSGRSTSELNCSPTAAGRYVVTLTVVDSLGRSNATTTTVDVLPAESPPVINQNPPVASTNPPWYYVLAAATALGAAAGLTGSLLLFRARENDRGHPDLSPQPEAIEKPDTGQAGDP